MICAHAINFTQSRSIYFSMGRRVAAYTVTLYLPHYETSAEKKKGNWKGLLQE